jgi:hypothetical protein
MMPLCQAVVGGLSEPRNTNGVFAVRVQAVNHLVRQNVDST